MDAVASNFLRAFPEENGQMTEVFTIGNEELAILCDFVGGWGGKWATNNLQTDKRQPLIG